MNGPQALAHLLLGAPAESIDPAELPPPYDEGARRLRAAAVGKRLAAMDGWLSAYPPEEALSLRRAILAAADALSLEPKETPDLGGDVVAAYLSQAKTLADAFGDTAKVPDVVQGLLPARSLTILYGSPGTLKTNILLDLGLAVATGQRWLPSLPGGSAQVGFAVTKQPVLWVDADSGNDVLKERIAAMARAYSAPLDAPFYWLTFPVPPVQAARGLKEVTIFAKAIAAGLIVFDNLLRIGGFRDENASEVDTAMAALRQLAVDTGAAVVIIHHRRKQAKTDRAGDTMRGHSSIESALDAALLVERDGDTVRLRATKDRRKPIASFAALWTYSHADDGQTLQLARFYRTVSDTAAEASKIERLKDRLQAAIKPADRPLNQSEVVAAVGGNRRAAIQALDVLVEDGAVKLELGPHGSKLYSIPAS